MKLNIKNLIGALYTINADASIILNEEEAHDVLNFIGKCDNHKTIIYPSEEFEDACEKLGISINDTNTIDKYWISNGNSILITYPF